MPKKKGKGKKAGGKEKAPGSPPKIEETVEAVDREALLQKEFDGLTLNLLSLKKEVDELRAENEFLQTEAQQTRVESHEYMSYMAKKTHKRQTTIITLSDQNQKELEKINRQKEIMLADYEAKKNRLKNEVLEKENMLVKATKEFADLTEYQELRDEQMKKIKQLERQILKMRGEHSDTIQQLKADFLQEKSQYTIDSEEKIKQLAREANKKAVKCLAEHADSIKQENRALRAELMQLIKKSRVLVEHKKELEGQKKELIREQQYSEDIRKLRGERQKKIAKRLEIAHKDLS